MYSRSDPRQARHGSAPRSSARHGTARLSTSQASSPGCGLVCGQHLSLTPLGCEESFVALGLSVLVVDRGWDDFRDAVVSHAQVPAFVFDEAVVGGAHQRRIVEAGRAEVPD